MINEDHELETVVRDILVEICATMFRYGYHEVPVPALLMLLGVDESRAQRHQGEYFVYDDDFVKQWQKQQKIKKLSINTVSKTVH